MILGKLRSIFVTILVHDLSSFGIQPQIGYAALLWIRFETRPRGGKRADRRLVELHYHVGVEHNY